MPSIDEVRARAIRHYGDREFQQAQALCHQILQVAPTDHYTLHLLAVTYVAAGRSDLAEPLLRRSISAYGADSLAHCNLGSVLANLGKLDESVASFETALRLKSDSIDALAGLGRSLNLRNDPKRAESLARTALGLNGAHAESWHVLGDSLRLQSRLTEAETCYRNTTQLNPGRAESLNNLGGVLRLLGKNTEALECYRRALALDSNYASPHNNIAILLKDLGRLDEAESHLRASLRLSPGMVDSLTNLGGILQMLGRLDEAMECFRTADAASPLDPTPSSNLLLCMNYHPRYEPPSLLAEHQKWGERFGKVTDVRIGPAPDHDRRADRKLRIGYVSPDFAGHAIAHFLLPILANHDPQRVEVFCYAQQTSTDSTTAVMKRYAHGWRNITALTDPAAADLIRSDRIDILVDLAGHTGSSRLRLFAHKPAPVQVTYLGYPNTTGLDTIDYRLTDSICDPPGEPIVHTEKLFRLPRAFCCFTIDTEAPDPGPLPAGRNGYVTFGSLHPLTRLNCGVLDTWCKILQSVPRSRLLIFRNTLQGRVKDDLSRYFMQRGISPDRLTLAHQPPASGYLGVYQDIDIALDTFPWSGHTAACQSLWMGVLIITLRGNRYAGRMVASVLHHVGGADLIANSLEGYVQIAVQMVSNVQVVADFRAGLRKRMSDSVLCDYKGFTRDLEDVYREMWTRRCADFA